MRKHKHEPIPFPELEEIEEEMERLKNKSSWRNALRSTILDYFPQSKPLMHGGSVVFFLFCGCFAGIVIPPLLCCRDCKSSVLIMIVYHISVFLSSIGLLGGAICRDDKKSRRSF